MCEVLLFSELSCRMAIRVPYSNVWTKGFFQSRGVQSSNPSTFAIYFLPGYTDFQRPAPLVRQDAFQGLTQQNLWPCSPQFPKQIPVFFSAAATEKQAWIRGKYNSPDYAVS